MKLDTDEVKRMMGERYMSGKDLAREIGLSSTSVYKMLRGETSPKPSNLRKICEALECEPRDIVEEW